MAAKSVRLYVDKNYRYHYLSILGHDPPANQSLETISGKMRDWDMDCDVDSGGEGEQRKAPDEPPQEIEEGTAIMSGGDIPIPPPPPLIREYMHIHVHYLHFQPVH